MDISLFHEKTKYCSNIPLLRISCSQLSLLSFRSLFSGKRYTYLLKPLCRLALSLLKSINSSFKALQKY